MFQRLDGTVDGTEDMEQTESMKKILIVDDEQLIAFGLSRALQNRQFEIKTVNRGDRALAEVSSSFYDLCFLDIRMPDLDGFEVMKRIKNISPETKIIIMTGSVLSDSEKEEIEKWAHRFVAKPFDLFEVLSMAEQAL